MLARNSAAAQNATFPFKKYWSFCPGYLKMVSEIMERNLSMAYLRPSQAHMGADRQTNAFMMFIETT